MRDDLSINRTTINKRVDELISTVNRLYSNLYELGMEGPDDISIVLHDHEFFKMLQRHFMNHDDSFRHHQDRYAKPKSVRIQFRDVTFVYIAKPK